MSTAHHATARRLFRVHRRDGARCRDIFVPTPDIQACGASVKDVARMAVAERTGALRRAQAQRRSGM